MVQGMLALLKNCPQEVAHLRRELLIAARHVLATDLRTSAFQYILVYPYPYVIQVHAHYWYASCNSVYFCVSLHTSVYACILRVCSLH